MNSNDDFPGEMTEQEKISRRTFMQISAGALAAAAVSGPEFLMAQQGRKLSIGSGGTGGSSYVLGGAISGMLTKNIPNVKVTAEATAGSLENARLLATRNADMAFMLGFEVLDAYLGRDLFKTKVPLRALMVVYTNQNTLIVREGIKSVQELKGKRVSLVAPGSGSEITGIRVMQAAGLDPDKDIKRDRLSHMEAANAMKDRKLDGFNAFSTSPFPALTDLTTTPGIKVSILDLSDLVPKLQAKYGPVYFGTVIPKGTYKGIDADVKTVASGTILTCHEALEEDLAYQIVKLIIEKKSELALAHKVANDISLQSAVVGSPVPFHAGALRYYKEKGITIKP
jgi:uncharacterized protein